MSKDKQLTKNFKLSEFACKDGTPVPNQYLYNVQVLANNLQVLRDYLQLPIHINSAYRTIEHNNSVGGSFKSQHLLAKAADIRVTNKTSRELKEAIEKLISEKRILQGGVGYYENFINYDTRGKYARW